MTTPTGSSSDRMPPHGTATPVPPDAQQPVLVVMGVSGSGKSTIAAELAERLGWDLGEGDDLHPAANVEKMRNGIPLTDADREPWLRAVAGWISERTDAQRPGIITCSALRHSYRDVLRGEHVVFVFLTGDREKIGARMSRRTGHYMPGSLLDSQLDTLEEPTVDENVLIADISASPDGIADGIIARLALRPTP